jgi:hypothetical protein
MGMGREEEKTEILRERERERGWSLREICFSIKKLLFSNPKLTQDIPNFCS